MIPAPDTWTDFLPEDCALALHQATGDEIEAFNAEVEAYLNSLSTERPKLRRYDGATVEDLSDHERYAGALLRLIATARARAERLARDELSGVVARVTAEWTRGHREKKQTSEVRAQHAEAARLKREARAAK